MARQGWSQFGVKRLEFGGRQWSPKELLLGGALAVVVLAALAMAVMHMMKPVKPESITYHLQCQKCKYEFPLKDTELPAYVYEKPNDPIKIDCPKCQAEKSAEVMSMCPKCLKYFYVPAGQQKICPTCKEDIAKLAADKKAGKF